MLLFGGPDAWRYFGFRRNCSFSFIYFVLRQSRFLGYTLPFLSEGTLLATIRALSASECHASLTAI
jgi:hypothetical protein